jgi:large repetitive protein
MSTNLFSRLRALLPSPAATVGTVVSVNGDGTSNVDLVAGAGSVSVAPGVATGSRVVVRGTAAIGARVLMRQGLIEAVLPDGDVVDAEIGSRISQPLGPPLLALAAPVEPWAAVVGEAYSFPLAAFFSGGWSPRTYMLTAGTLPPGLALDAATGVISGTRTAATGGTGLVVACQDSTRRQVLSGAFDIASA